MTFSAEYRHKLLRHNADAYLDLALHNVQLEYPHMPWFVASGPESYRTHRELHPAFFGSFDWHSCVEMHWTAIRLLRLFPGLDGEQHARRVLGDLLTEKNIAQELVFFHNPNQRSFERPYGWGWLLMLHHELTQWNDDDGRRWADAVEPLADLVLDRFAEWLPKMTYPQRVGMHANSAFGLSLAWDAASQRRPDVLEMISAAGLRWFNDDTDYPAHYEPSGADFLSAGLCEAELMSRILPADEFPIWMERFLPGLQSSEPAQIFTPAIVSDETDGQIAHLQGLNLSRSWAFLRLVNTLPADDARRSALERAAELHAEASLDQVIGSDYMVEHWLAAYATLLLSEA